VYFGEEKVKFSRISTVSLIHHTIRTKVSKHLCPNFSGFLTYQNFWRCTCTPRPLHHYRTGLEIKYGDPITVIHGIKYRYPTNSLAISI